MCHISPQNPYFCSAKMVPQEVVQFLTLEVVLFLTLEGLKVVLKLTLQHYIILIAILTLQFFVYATLH